MRSPGSTCLRASVLMLLLALGSTSRAAEPTSLAELLQQEITFSADDQSLLEVCEKLSKQIAKAHPKLDFSIKLVGADLQAEGITRNQRIKAFQLEKATLADALTYIVKKGNPGTAVMDLTGDLQKLVWVVTTDPDNPQRDVVLITSRAAAKKKMYPLGKPFVKE